MRTLSEQFKATCWLIVVLLLFLSVQTLMRTLSEQFKATCWLIVFFLNCFFICSHTDEDFEQFMATCWLIVVLLLFLSVHTQMRTLNSSWQLVDSLLFCCCFYLFTHRWGLWTVHGNLLTHCLKKKSVHTPTRTLLEQFKATCWLIFVCLFLFYLFTHRWGLCLNSSKQLVDFF